MQHLEVVNFNGRLGFASLPLLWPKGADAAKRAARLRKIMAWHEANGVPVFDPQYAAPKAHPPPSCNARPPHPSAC